MRLPPLLRMLAWVVSAHVAFAATYASVWLGHLDRLGVKHDPWLSTSLHFFAAFSAVAVLAYAGAAAGFALMPGAFKRALAQRDDDRWAYLVAVLCGAALGAVWSSIFSSAGDVGMTGA